MSGKRKSVFVSLEHSLEELLGLFFLRVGEEVFRSAFFDDEAVGHEDDFGGDFAREVHLVGDDDHRDAKGSNFSDGVEDFADEFRIEG